MPERGNGRREKSSSAKTLFEEEEIKVPLARVREKQEEKEWTKRLKKDWQRYRMK